MRVIVCGGRNYADADRLYAELDAVHAVTPITILSHGAAPGADSLAAALAKDRNISEQAFPADWLRYGHSAGPIRNEAMLRAVQPDCVLAFPGGRGTAHMIRIARRRGISVRLLAEEGTG